MAGNKEIKVKQSLRFYPSMEEELRMFAAHMGKSYNSFVEDILQDYVYNFKKVLIKKKKHG